MPTDLCAVCGDQRSNSSVSPQAPPTLFVETRSLTAWLSSKLQELLAFASQCLDYRFIPTPIPSFLFVCLFLNSGV